MEKKESRVLGFFRRIILAMTDFRLYPYVQREKVSVATAYFTLLAVLITIFLALSFGNKIIETVSDTLNGYDEKIPEFTLKDGTLDVIEKIYNENGETRVVVDTYMNSKEFANTESGKEVLYSNSFVVINSDGIIYGTRDATMIYLFKNVDLQLTKSTLHDYLQIINEDWTVKCAIYAVIWLGVFIAYYIIKMINILFLILMAWILNIVFGMKLKFGNYYRIVVYALTLPLLVEMTAILYLGRIPEFATLAYQMLAYVYIFYALRAIKLDIILISTPGTDFKEKVENMIQKLENEIEEKMKKEADEKKNEDNKEENNKREEKKDDE